MGAKGEINWKRRDEYGERLECYARNERNVWKFFRRERRFARWEVYPEPALEDWLELLDGVRRRDGHQPRAQLWLVAPDGQAVAPQLVAELGHP